MIWIPMSRIAQLGSMSQELPSCTLLISDTTLSKLDSILCCVNTCVYPYVFLSDFLSNLFPQMLLPFPEAGSNDFRSAFSTLESL